MKRCLSLLLTVVLLLGVFSVPASAKSSAKTELLTEKVLYKSTGYNWASNSGPYLKMSVSCKQVDKSFLFIKYKKYISSVLF
ncbi:MAG: hypothetical protein J6S00_02935 [Clostridia bacterium]|nr:hypothetical protein [Clostridia bacterium]